MGNRRAAGVPSRSRSCCRGNPMIRHLLALALVNQVACLAIPGVAGAAEAQQPGKVHRVGFLSYFGCARSASPEGAFRQTLRSLGYVEGQNIVIECRDAPGRVDRLPDLAIDLVNLRVDALVAEATPGTLAAKRATSTIPIVMFFVADPVKSGLVASLAHPGSNVTGVSGIPALETLSKVLELLKEVVPKVSRVAILTDRTNPGQVVIDDSADATARALRVQLLRINVRGAADLQGAFKAVLDQRAQALFVYPLPVEPAEIRRIADFALVKRLPAVTLLPEYAQLGLLISYGVGGADQYRRAAVYLDKILKGAKPADLPVEQPTQFELVVNLRTAKALGITIPESIRLRADEVIR
jgi:putative tryptophan/tyrosine transport system substrate-binding protein